MKMVLLVMAAGLAGCMTLDKLPTARTYDVFEAGCMGRSGSDLQQAALRELTSRGLTCSDVARQVLQIRAANPQVYAPVQSYQQQPYVMPTQQQYQSQPVTAHGTLVDQQPATSATGASAYMCSYRTGAGFSSVIRPTSDGPCPPSANLR